MSEISMATSATASIPVREIIRQPVEVTGNRKLLRNQFRAAAPYLPKNVFHFEPLENHPDLKKITFKHPNYNIDIHAYASIIEGGGNDQIVGAFSSGLKETTPFKMQRIEHLRVQRIPTIFLRLPNVGNHPHIVPFYMDIMRYFFLDKRSPVHELYPNNKKVAGGHSTGGFGATALATHPRTSDMMGEIYEWLYCDSPFYDSPNASLLDPLWRQVLYTFYAEICGDKVPEETYIGNFYLVFQDMAAGKIKTPEQLENRLHGTIDGLSAGKLHKWLAVYAENTKRWEIFKAGGNPWANEIPAEARGLDCRYRLPTYDQMIELRDYARHHFRYLNEHGVPEHVPMTIYSDLRDPFSSGITAKEKALTVLGAEFVEATGFHNQLNDDDLAFEHFVKSIKNLGATLQEKLQPQQQALAIA